MPPPDYTTGGDNYMRYLQLWYPQPDRSGRAVIQINDGKSPWRTSEFDGIDLPGDIEGGVETIVKLQAFLPGLYEHLGIFCSRTTLDDGREQITADFPHSTIFVKQLGKLAAMAGVQTPGFKLTDGQFRARDNLLELANKRFSLAANGPYYAHDLFAHAAPAQIYVPPQALDNIASESGQTLATGDESLICDKSEWYDGWISYAGHGTLLAGVLKHDPDILSCSTPPSDYADNLWQEAAQRIGRKVQGQEFHAGQRARELRRHCQLLGQAAVELVAA